MATGDYVNPNVLRSFLRIADGLDDIEITAAITAASRRVDTLCRRFFYTTTSLARTFRAPCGDTLDVPDMAAAPTVVTDYGSTLTLNTDYYLEPLDGYDSVGRASPYQSIVRVGRWSQPTTGLPSITVTTMWGWAAVPDEVAEATKLIAADLLANRDNKYGVIGLDAGAPVRMRVNLQAAALLDRFAREPVVA